MLKMFGYLICKKRYAKMVRYAVFYGDFENEQKKGIPLHDCEERSMKVFRNMS